MTPPERMPIIYFLIVFPFVVLGVFTYLVSFRAGQLFAPGDFRNEDTYLKLQQMRLSAVASLTVAQQTKGLNRTSGNGVEIERLVDSVESAVALVQKGTTNPTVLWVDDRHDNNIYERKAMEAVGIRFTLSESTNDALRVLSRQSFGAVISDMGRVEGPREGYALLDAMRSNGDATPLFFYASSNATEHKRETYEHGGQGCTNDGQELFDMVTKAVLGPQSTKRRSSSNLRAPRERNAPG